MQMATQRFTDKMLKGLKAPTKGQVDHWDELLPGFGVRIGTTGRKSFFVGIRINGRYRRITIKPPYYEDGDLARARSQAKAIMADAHAGIGPELRKKREEKGTFGAVAAAFVQDHAAHLRTRRETQRIINVYLTEWRDRQISEITRADIKELVREKARTAPTMANRLAAQISTIFAWALKEELIESSPAVRIDRPGQEVERERSLTADEIKTAWAAFDELGYPHGPLFKLLLVTGQRRGEVTGMRWSEVTPEGWKLPGERAKRGRGHLVPLSSLAREILGEVPELSEFVFRGRKDAPTQSWGKADNRLRKLCGPMEPWRVHDLRRTFATHLRSIGIDRLVVSKLLNHAEGGITRIYDRYTADPEKAAAMERWANRLREIVSGTPAENVVQMRAL
jgi:integrase